MLKTWLRKGEQKRLAATLFARIAARARETVFFATLHVPDTLDGRFDLLTLHAWLVLERLEAFGERDTAQGLINAIFVQFDEGLRDLGAGDIGIGHRVKKMADAFYGRLKAYGDAGDEGALASAILRNIYRSDAPKIHYARALAAYTMRAREALAHSTPAEGALDFGPLPALAETT
jgi:cytochrome b pre-mRNA-processing protein 3